MKKIEIASSILKKYASREQELSNAPLQTNIGHVISELQAKNLRVEVKFELKFKYCVLCDKQQTHTDAEFVLSCGDFICSAECLKHIANEATNYTLNNLLEVQCLQCRAPISEHEIYRAFGGKVNVDIIISRAAERMLQELLEVRVLTKTCPMCYDDKSPDDFVLMTFFCEHSLCKGCYVEHLEYLITHNQVTPDKFVCAEVGCGKEIDPYFAFGHLSDNQGLIEKFTTFKLRVMEGGEASTECPGIPGVNCQQIYFYDIATVGIVCQVCSAFFCPKCKDRPHSGRTCDEFREWKAANDVNEQEYEALMKREGCMRCPVCKNMGFKYQGCQFIYCACKANYCYLCGTQLTEADHYTHFKNKPFGNECLGPKP
jgi:hypothetical protein